MHGSVSTTYVRLLHEFLARRGLDAAAVLGEAAPAEDASGLARYPVARWAALLARADRALAQPALGLAVGALIAPAHLGLLGYLTLCCANLGEALARLRDYERLVYDVNAVRLTADATAVTLEWGEEMGRPGQLVDECALAALVAYARDITARPALAPLEVRFINPEPPSREPYERYFGCPVGFGAATTVVRLPIAQLALGLRQPDAALRSLLDAQARERLARLPPRDAFEAGLRTVIAGQLAGGEASLAASAERLHCSARTLQRRLAAAGTTFQAVLDRTREQLVDSYLADPRLKLAEIALLLGYADQAAFTRAFQRWKGCTPGQFRRGQRPPARGAAGPVEG